MPESLWLFPILSGYYFLTRYVYLKYKYDRLETQAGGSRYSVGPTSWQGLWKAFKNYFKIY